MNSMTEAKSSAANFLAAHDQLLEDFTSAKLEVDDQRKEIERLDAKLSLQSEMLKQAIDDKSLYLQYAFELAAQLQFMVAGSARALMIAGHIRNQISAKGAKVTPVPGADVEELEGILYRIGENNAAANDGNGMTNSKPVAELLVSKELATELVFPPGTGSKTITPGDVEKLLSSEADGVLVDRNGNPVIEPSTATRMINEL